jgi:hypothetical protein
VISDSGWFDQIAKSQQNSIKSLFRNSIKLTKKKTKNRHNIKKFFTLTSDQPGKRSAFFGFWVRWMTGYPTESDIQIGLKISKN